jgi:hypothetical protein
VSLLLTDDPVLDLEGVGRIETVVVDELPVSTMLPGVVRFDDVSGELGARVGVGRMDVVVVLPADEGLDGVS